MEWPSCQSDARQHQPHGIVGFGVEDVQAASAIHEDLGQACLANDGVDDETEPARLWNVVGVVGSVDGDCRLRPPEVGWDSFTRRGGGVNLPSYQLVPTLRLVSRRPPKDHETSLQPWENVLLISLAVLAPFALGGRCNFALQVPLHEVIVLVEVLDRGTMVRAWSLHHLIEVAIVLDSVGPARLLLAVLLVQLQ